MPPPLFKTVAIETSAYCNRRCGFCPNSLYAPSKNKMDDAVYSHIIDQLQSLRYEGTIVLHQFNEPLLDERLCSLIRSTRARLPQTTIMFSTNGDYLNFDAWTLLRIAGLNYIVIACYDGFVPQHIQKLISKLRASDRRAMFLRVRGFHNMRNTRSGLVNSMLIPKKPLKQSCQRPFSQLVIRHNNKAVLCCEDYLCNCVIADVRQTQLTAIWQSSIMRYNRNMLKLGIREGICASCNTTDWQSRMSCEWVAKKRSY